MDCFVASAQNCFAILSRAPLRKRFAFVAGNDAAKGQPATFTSSGTAASYFELCSTSDVRTLRT
jgi:hypothetical protein